MALRVTLAALAALSLLIAGLGIAVWFQRIPPTSELEPVDGTVQRTKVLRGEAENFLFWLDDGRPFIAIDTDPKYHQVKEEVKDGVKVSMLARGRSDGAAFVQLEVDGRTILSLAEARRADGDYIRHNLILAAFFTAFGVILLGTLAFNIWRPPPNWRRL